jgi:ubiquinone/menaquinone biosynthesis C-methylase UbiE
MSDNHRCPWWIGWLLASPLRRCLENPDELVLPLLARGNQVLELGPGMGFFTLPMARHVGSDGHLHCVDIQPQMLTGLERRLRRHGLASQVSLRGCTERGLALDDLEARIDLAVLIHVLHETHAPEQILQEISGTLRPGGRVLLIEPPFHVKPEQFRDELTSAKRLGLIPIPHPHPSARTRRHLAVFRRP